MEEQEFFKWIKYMAIILFGVLFIFLLVNFSAKPQFTIYKEECWNETFIEDTPIPLHLLCASQDAKDLDCMKKLMDACERFGGELWKDKDFSFTSYCIMKDVEQKRKVCKKKEVDEIEYCDTTFGKNGKIIGEDKRYDNNWVEIRSCWYFGDDGNWTFAGVPISKISKKDLTKEWLEENCECIEGNYLIDNKFFDKFPKNNCLECESERKNIYNEVKCLINIANKECLELIKFYSYESDCERYKCFKNYFIEIK